MGLSKKSNFLLDTAPQKSVNASCPASRLTTHDSGSVWLARPSPYGCFIRSSTPVYPGAPIHIAAPPQGRRAWLAERECNWPRLPHLLELAKRQ